MRFLKKNARVMIVATLVITALLLVGLMMVPQQGKKIGIVSCSAGDVLYSCHCPDGYGDSDAYHDAGDCYINYGKTEMTCETNKSCWKHKGDNWYSASCTDE